MTFCELLAIHACMYALRGLPVAVVVVVAVLCAVVADAGAQPITLACLRLFTFHVVPVRTNCTGDRSNPFALSLILWA